MRSNTKIIENQNDSYDSNGLLNHPKYAQYFKKRVCNRFVRDQKY